MNPLAAVATPTTTKKRPPKIIPFLAPAPTTTPKASARTRKNTTANQLLALDALVALKRHNPSNEPLEVDDEICVFTNFDRQPEHVDVRRKIVQQAYDNLALKRRGSGNLVYGDILKTLDALGLPSKKANNIDADATLRAADLIVSLLSVDQISPSVSSVYARTLQAIEQMTIPPTTAPNQILLVLKSAALNESTKIQRPVSISSSSSVVVCFPTIKKKTNDAKHVSLVAKNIVMLVYYLIRTCVERLRNLMPDVQVAVCLRFDTINDLRVRQAVETAFCGANPPFSYYALGVTCSRHINNVYIM